MSERCILHGDMDAFYASIEQRDDPALRGKPVIVGGAGRRGVVAAASYEARAFGVHSAMPGAIARRKCPDGVFVRPRMAAYAAVSRQIHQVFAAVTPLVEPLSLDEAFLDVSGSQAMYGDGQAIAQRIRRLISERTGLTISVGVASCKFVAKVASDLRKPDALVVVPPGQERAFLAPLPIRRLWGAGRVTQERFAQLGLHQIGDLQVRTLEQLADMLGPRMGQHYYELSRGIDERPVIVDRDPRSVSNEVTFGEDLQQRQACHQVLLELSEKVGARLRHQGLTGQVVRLKLRDPDFATVTRQRKLAQATDDELRIYHTVRELFDTVRQTMRPVRLLGVGVADLESGAGRQGDSQGELFADTGCTDEITTDRPAPLLRAIDEIRQKFGDTSIRHGRVTEGDVGEE